MLGEVDGGDAGAQSETLESFCFLLEESLWIIMLDKRLTTKSDGSDKNNELLIRDDTQRHANEHTVEKDTHLQ